MSDFFSGQLLSADAVACLLDVSKRTVFRWTADLPGFPAPYRLTTQTVRWSHADVTTWLQTRRHSAEGVHVLPAHLQNPRPRAPRARRH
jgi:predicted DNA-binding transcriptional regulator AlpA